MNFKINSEHSIDDDDDIESKNDRGGLIVPKQTCEHVQHVSLLNELTHINNNQCVDCESKIENWLCLSCGEIHCSRYINNHGKIHWLFTLLTDTSFSIGHCLTISLQDLSVWCYACKSYIKNVRLDRLIQSVESIKFGTKLVDENKSTFKLTNKSVSTKQNEQSLTLIAVQNQLLLDKLKATDILSYCYSIKIRSASIDELSCLHSSSYVNNIVSSEKTNERILNPNFHIKNDKITFSNARVSAGITIDIVQNVLRNRTNGFALLTSTGHRAISEHGNGISIYNNVAVAINSVLTNKALVNKRRSTLKLMNLNHQLHVEGKSAIYEAFGQMIYSLTPEKISETRENTEKQMVINDKKKSPLQINRVLILDITREHGYGIQSIYYESNQVCYISIHRENHQHLSSYHECGKNEGMGYNINIPLAKLDVTSENDYIEIIKELVFPIIKEFEPELIIVCLDFSIQELTPLCYGWIVEQLIKMNDNRVVVTLDGDLSCIISKISYIETVLSVLVGKLSNIDNEQWKTGSDINSDAHKKVHIIKEKNKRYWNCFN